MIDHDAQSPIPLQMRTLLLCSLLCLGLLAAPPTALADARLDDMELTVLGQKFPQDPMATRIARLEKVLKPKTPPKASLSYRLDTMYLAAANTVPAENEQAAIRAYNFAIDESNQKRYESAIEAYRKAINLNPRLTPAYNNLGNLLEQLHKYEEAQQVYLTALKHNPDEPLLHRNLGIVYEKTGRIQDAVAEYKQYLQRVPQADPTIANLVRHYESGRQLGAATLDYADAAQTGSQGQKLTWRPELNPIPVYIQMDPDQTAFLPAIVESLKIWEEATGRRVQFRQTGNPREGRIRIRLQEGPLAHPSSEVGHATYDVMEDTWRRQRDMRVTVTVNTGERAAPIPLEQRLEHIKRLALHEIGHAIGIWGHSPDPEDIMYTHPIVSKLSPRDIRTIQRLYAETDRRSVFR